MKLSLNFGAFVDGLSVFLIGVSMVFVVLLLLILLIKIIGWLVETIENKKAESIAAKTPVIKQEQVEINVQDSTPVDELELVAVITATIAASLGTTSDRLQVRSLRQINRNRA